MQPALLLCNDLIRPGDKSRLSLTGANISPTHDKIRRILTLHWLKHVFVYVEKALFS